jgi:hypothetical protein
LGLNVAPLVHDAVLLHLTVHPQPQQLDTDSTPQHDTTPSSPKQ